MLTIASGGLEKKIANVNVGLLINLLFAFIPTEKNTSVTSFSCLKSAGSCQIQKGFPAADGRCDTCLQSILMAQYLQSVVVLLTKIHCLIKDLQSPEWQQKSCQHIFSTIVI